MEEKEEKVRGLCGHLAKPETKKCPECGKPFMVYKSAYEVAGDKEVAIPSLS